MLKDIKRITELYLYSHDWLPENKSWTDYHGELARKATQEGIELLADSNPKDKCKYALFVDVDTTKKTCNVKDYIEIDQVKNWGSHLFWQGSGGSRSDDIRNTPHKVYDGKGKFSADSFIRPLETILDDYCSIVDGKGKNQKVRETGPLFWDINKIEERRWIKNIVDILKNKKEEITTQIKGEEKKQGKFPSVKPGEAVFVGLTIDGKAIGKYELFRRYLSFVRTRAGIQKGPDKFKHRIAEDVIKELRGICHSCQKENILLDQWQGPAELSFYQTTNENHLSYDFPSSAFKLCQGCADLLFIFKQRLLDISTRRLGGNECLILPSIKILPKAHNEKRRLYEHLKGLWSLNRETPSAERRLLYRLGQLPSYATVTFVFGEYITGGKSQNVRRLDELNVVFPDVLPSRLSQIANAIQDANNHLNEMWLLTGRNWNCTWYIRDDRDSLQLLQDLFHPFWDEDKKNKDKQKKRYKSIRRTEMERYLRAIFYGQVISNSTIAEDCYPNLIAAFRTTRNSTGKKDDNDKYVLLNYIGNILSLLVFVEKLRKFRNPQKETINMVEEILFEYNAMPELGKFIEKHPLLRDRQYLAPFFVGCLFSYAENLQKENSRLAAYKWLGTMALSYDDILQDIYPKALDYIANKEKIVKSPRLQELTKAIAYHDRGRCDNDRVALTAFCHGWAVGRDFIYMKKAEPKTTTNINEGGNNNG